MYRIVLRGQVSRTPLVPQEPELIRCSLLFKGIDFVHALAGTITTQRVLAHLQILGGRVDVDKHHGLRVATQGVLQQV